MFASDQPGVANQLPISVEYPRNPEELQYTQELLYKRIANAVNSKEGALYFPVEVSTFQQYFTPDDPQRLRATYRKTIDFGVLPNAGTKTVPHGITFTEDFSMTRMYGAATDPVSPFRYIPLPYAHPTANTSIALEADGTNVTVITGINYSNFTRCTVVLEYTKNL